jgi:hypothetical protein
MASKTTTLYKNDVIIGYTYTNDFTDVDGNHNSSILYDALWQELTSILTITKDSTITSSTWETIKTLDVVTHRETGYSTEGSFTSKWEYKFDANWHLTYKNFSQIADITKLTKVVINGETGYEATVNGKTSHYDSTGLLTFYRIPYNEVETSTNSKTGARTYDTNWHPLDDTWTNSKDGSIISQKTLTDSLGIVTYLQNGHNSAGTSTWEYHFDASWHLIDGKAVDGILTTTFGTNFKIISQTGDISKITEVLINGVSCYETIAIDAASGKQIETLYTHAGALTGYRMNDDKTTGGKFFPGTITFDTTWKTILNKTWTNSDGTTVSEDNITDSKGIITHVQKGHDSISTNTWEYHFDAKWILIDGWSSDGFIKTTYGTDFIKISSIADTSNLTRVTDNLGVVTGYEKMDNASTISFFDKAGVPTGHRTFSTTVDSKGILSTTMTNFDADWKMLGSSWTRSDGTSGITDVTHNPDGKVLVTTETGHKADSTGTMNWVYHFDAEWNFLGGTIYDGVTKTMKAFAPDWTEMTPLKNDAAHPDLVPGYKWTDATNLDHTTTFFDLEVFNITGYSQPYTAKDLVDKITAGTRTYNAHWRLENKTWTTIDGFTVSEDPHYGSDGKTITGYEQISHNSTNTSIVDYHFDAKWDIVSGTIIDFSGIVTTTIGSKGIVISRTTDITQMTAIKDISDNVLEYQKIEGNTTIHSKSTGDLTSFSEITETKIDPITYNSTSKETNYASDHTTKTGYEEISHNSDSSSYWDVIFDTKYGIEGRWEDDGVSTKAFDGHDVLLKEFLDAGHAVAAHFQALQLIGVAPVAHDQVV